ncbi:MAG: hypothetical protein ACM32F_03690 [Betaproteobacteria bacterium]|jgi:5-methylcytosine-specific restriction endonuclease McrA
MPIRKELRPLYPTEWPSLSRAIRFERAGGRCERCGRPHRFRIRQLGDGRWYDAGHNDWRNDRGDEAPWPDIVDYATVGLKQIILAAAHLDHDPTNSSEENLEALCQRCHLAHDRPHHRRRFAVTILARRALGDLFSGPYLAW